MERIELHDDIFGNMHHNDIDSSGTKSQIKRRLYFNE